MRVNRRDLFVVLGACAATSSELFAAHDHHAAIDEKQLEKNLDHYRPRALTSEEFRLVDRLAETILPADDAGPGAHDAHVAYFVDVVLVHAADARRARWKAGLAALDRTVTEQFAKQFVQCSPEQQQEALIQIARNEMAPRTDLERFFVELKQETINAFYLSDLIQRQYLGYKGNTAIDEFPGCTHHHVTEA